MKMSCMYFYKENKDHVFLYACLLLCLCPVTPCVYVSAVDVGWKSEGIGKLSMHVHTLHAHTLKAYMHIMYILCVCMPCGCILCCMCVWCGHVCVLASIIGGHCSFMNMGLIWTTNSVDFVGRMLSGRVACTVALPHP